MNFRERLNDIDRTKITSEKGHTVLFLFKYTVRYPEGSLILHIGMQQQEVEEYVAIISDLKRHGASHKQNSDPEAAYWKVQHRVAAELGLSIEVPVYENDRVSGTVSDNAMKIDTALATGQEEEPVSGEYF